MYQSLINIPLIAKTPNGVGAGERRAGIVQPADTMPTILDFLCIDVPERCHGQSFLPLLKEQSQKRRPYAFSGAYNNIAHVSNSQWSYGCWERRHQKLGELRHVLFDLENDPLQTQNVIEENCDIVDELHTELVSFFQSIDVPAEKIARFEAIN